MPPLNIGALRAVANRLDATGLEYAFTGGSVVNLLMDNPELATARPTEDVDVIVELLSSARYSDIEDILRAKGFQNDMSKGAPICRWRLKKLVVDIMPTEGQQIGLNTQWFREVLADARIVEYAGTRLKVASPTGFLALKYLTFIERGKEDYSGSHDLEDFLTVVDGREGIVREIDESPAELRDFLALGARDLLEKSDFIEALPGHLPPDSASQRRLPLLRTKLEEIAAMQLSRK